MTSEKSNLFLSCVHEHCLTRWTLFLKWHGGFQAFRGCAEEADFSTLFYCYNYQPSKFSSRLSLSRFNWAPHFLTLLSWSLWLDNIIRQPSSDFYFLSLLYQTVNWKQRLGQEPPTTSWHIVRWQNRHHLVCKPGLIYLL